MFSAILESGNTSKDDNWSCSLRLHDGILYSGWGNSSNLTLDADVINPVISAPSASILEYNIDGLYVIFNATDENTVTWIINETGNFTIDSSSGVLVNDTVLVMGSYSILVTATDEAGNIDTEVYSVSVGDTVAPVASASCSPSSGYVGTIVTCTCSGTDIGSGINSSLTGAGSTSTASSVGTFTYTCSVIDNAGNSDSDTASYVIASLGGGGTGAPIYYPSVDKLSEGYDISLGKNFKVNFQVSGQSHALRVDDISLSSATVTISSDPITLEINLLSSF